MKVEEREREQLLMVISPIPTTTTPQSTLGSTGVTPLQGSSCHLPVSQPPYTKHIQVIDVSCPAFTASTPNARKMYFLLPCLETEMLSHRTSLVVQLD